MKTCPKCNAEHKKPGTFCSRKCANSRVQSEEANRARSAKLSGTTRPDVPLGGCFKRHDPVLHTCKVCGKTELVRYLHRNKATCGAEDCIIQAKIWQRTYQNGSRKPSWFFNPNENKEVLLESSWEVNLAQYLIDNNIKWVRPGFIKWKDESGKTRRYFPDFYLTDYKVYLDPKNPYCMEKDKEKMHYVSQLVNIVFGDLLMIKNTINSLCKITE